MPPSQAKNLSLIAAIDLGSNSFRLEIGRIEHGQFYRTEYLKETVRQGNGLDDNYLSHDPAVVQAYRDDPFGDKLDYRLAADVNEPYFLSPLNRLNGTLFAERQSEPNLYQRQAYGAEVALTDVPPIGEQQVRVRVPFACLLRAEHPQRAGELEILEVERFPAASLTDTK